MREKRHALPEALLVLTLIAVSALIFQMPPTANSPSAETRPSTSFAPLVDREGYGLPSDLMASVSGWDAPNLKANNTLSQYSYRNVSFSEPVPSTYSKIWQDITISGLTAESDVREVQYGDSPSLPTDFLTAKDAGSGTYAQVAMRFTVSDKVNLTGIWLYYSSNGPMNLNIVNSSVNPDTTPNGRPTIATYALPTAFQQWNRVDFNEPLTIQAGFYYWVVVNATGIPATTANCYYIADAGGVEDGKCAAAFRSVWRDETLLYPTYPYLNLMLMLNVLPVSLTDASDVRVYSSPSQVDMKEENSNTVMSGDTTRIPVGWSTFLLSVNTSVTFVANWTARFEKLQNAVVTTAYRAYDGGTLWNATFASDSKPSGVPHTVFNRTLRVAPISSYWQLSNPSSNVTNSNKINFTVGWAYGQGYVLLTQTDDVNETSVWSATWNIMAESLYTIDAFASSAVIVGQQFNLTVSATILPSTRTILVLDRMETVVYNRSFSVLSSPYNHPLKLNATDDYNIIVFDRCLLQNEVDLFNASWITALEAHTLVRLESPTVSATWGDSIHIRVNYVNATQGINQTFPQPPLPSISVGGYNIPTVTSEGAGWYSFNYPSSRLPAAGSYPLSVSCSYMGTYGNATTLNLTLAKVNMTVSVLVEQTEVSAGSSLTVLATLTYQKNGSYARDGLNLRFEFLVTYKNASESTITKYQAILGGTATSNLLATDDMESITVLVTYEGTGILTTATDSWEDIPVTAPSPSPFPLPLLVGAVGGGSLLVILPLVVRARRKKGKEKEERKASRLEESAGLAQLVVVDATGRNVYSRKLGSVEGVDPQLISGFLKANEQLLGEVFGEGKTKAGLKSADYGDYKVVAEAGKYIMTALFCTEKAGSEIKNALAEFTKQFEEKFGGILQKWDGDTAAFKGADRLFNTIFPLTTTCPYMIDQEKLKSARLGRAANEALDRARRLSAVRGFFFMPKIIDFLMTEKGKKRSAVMDVLDELSRAGVFVQLTLEEAEAIAKSKAGQQSG